MVSQCQKVCSVHTADAITVIASAAHLDEKMASEQESDVALARGNSQAIEG